MCQCLRCDFRRSTQRERCKFHSILGSVVKFIARQTLTFQPLPWTISLESSRHVTSRNQGTFSRQREDPGNEVAKKWEIFNKRYLWKYWSSVLETWHHKCASQKKQNDTLNAVAMVTVSAPVSFCQKTKCPHLQPLKWDRGFYLKQT